MQIKTKMVYISYQLPKYSLITTSRQKSTAAVTGVPRTATSNCPDLPLPDFLRDPHKVIIPRAYFCLLKIDLNISVGNKFVPTPKFLVHHRVILAWSSNNSLCDSNLKLKRSSYNNNLRMNSRRNILVQLKLLRTFAIALELTAFNTAE